MNCIVHCDLLISSNEDDLSESMCEGVPSKRLMNLFKIMRKLYVLNTVIHFFIIAHLIYFR